jgi:hypothetical protein
VGDGAKRVLTSLVDELATATYLIS